MNKGVFSLQHQITQNPTTMKQILISVILLILVPRLLTAAETPSGTVRGTVVDKVTRNTLPGANIVLLNIQPVTGTSTDENGKFRIAGIPVGRVSLKVNFMGYKEIVLNNLNLNTGKELVLEIELEENIISQKGVEIKSDRDRGNAINRMNSVSSRSFTVEETGRYAGSRNDVARMASNYAGVIGSNDARNDIIIRGNSPSGLLWRLEGIDIPNPNHYGSSTATGGPVCMLNNNLLSNSDFLTGAFPAEYGNGMSGVFDLKMRNGNNEKHEFLGQVGFNGFEAGAEGPINRKTGASYLLNARYSTLEFMDKMGADLGTGTGIPMYKDFAMKINLPNTKLGNFSIFALGGISDIEIWDSRKDTTKETVDFYGGEGYDLTNGSDMATGGITNTYFWNSKTYTKLTLAASYHNFVTTVDSLTPGFTSKTAIYNNDFIETSLTASFLINHKINSRSFVKAGIFVKKLGFDLKEKIWFNEDNGLRTVSDFNGSSWLYQPYAQMQYKFTEELILNAGVHAMYYDLNKDYSIEPRAGVRWNFSPAHTLSLGYGLHSQLNSISIYFRQTRMADGTFQRLNENLDMPKSQHLVLGYDWNIHSNLRLKAEAYYQWIHHAGINGGQRDEYSILNQGANFGYSTPDTINASGKGTNYGIELTLEHFLNRGLYFLVTTSLFESKYTGSDDIERNTAFNGNYVVNILIGKEFELDPKSSTKKARTTLGFDLKTTYAGGQRYTPSTVVADPVTGGTTYMLKYDNTKAFSLQYDDYSRTDLKLTYRRNGKKITQEFALDIQNIFNQKNIYAEKLNKKTGEKSFTYQTGLLIIPQYRIIF